MPRHNGFTFAELLITLAIAGILLGIALPSLVSTLKNNQVTAQTNSFVSALNLARNEAVRYGRAVTVCASGNGKSCDDAPWDAGWLLWVDRNGDRIAQDAETIETFRSLDAETRLVEHQGTREVRFLADGSRSGRHSLDFVISAHRCIGGAARRVTISASGRPFTREMPCPRGS